MVTEALSSEETTVEAAITAVSGLSSYFSAVVALTAGLFGPQLFTIFRYSFFACAALSL